MVASRAEALYLCNKMTARNFAAKFASVVCRVGERILASVAQAVRMILLGVLHCYRWTLSPFLAFVGGPGSGCRFVPTCSQYAIEAIQSHGAMRGSLLAVRRVCRCHPWGGFGFDPVPPSAPQTARQKVSSADLHLTCSPCYTLPQVSPAQKQEELL